MILCEVLRLTFPRSWDRFLDPYEFHAICVEGQKARQYLKSIGLEAMAEYEIVPIPFSDDNPNPFK